MTRFKDLKRIDLAIKNQDVKELQWAIGYSKSRLQIAHRKEHIKYWWDIIEKLNQQLKSE
jgi:hypothetical protein